MREPVLALSWLKRTVLRLTALYSLTGTVTSPKLMAPVQIERGIDRSVCPTASGLHTRRTTSCVLDHWWETMSCMGRHLVLTVVAALALTGTAQAQTTLSASVKATPAKAGTAKRPQGVKLAVHADITTPEGAEHPIVTGFELWTGAGIVYHRDR